MSRCGRYVGEVLILIIKGDCQSAQIPDMQQLKQSKIFHCKLKFRGHSPRNSHSGRAKLAAKVPKIRSFSKIVVHNFYGVINPRFEEFRGRKCKKLREIGIIAGVVDDVKRNFKKGMIKNDQFKNQRKRN